MQLNKCKFLEVEQLFGDLSTHTVPLTLLNNWNCRFTKTKHSYENIIEMRMNCEKNDDLPFGKMYICAGPHFLSHCSASWVSEMSYTAIAVYKKTSGFEEIKFSVYDEFKVELILIPLQPALAWEDVHWNSMTRYRLTHIGMKIIVEDCTTSDCVWEIYRLSTCSK